MILAPLGVVDVLDVDVIGEPSTSFESGKSMKCPSMHLSARFMNRKRAF